MLERQKNRRPANGAGLRYPNLWAAQSFQRLGAGAGTPLSKSMSIEHWAGRLERRRVKASRGEFDDGGYLLVGQMKPLDDFVDRGACFQIVKNN